MILSCITTEIFPTTVYISCPSATKKYLLQNSCKQLHALSVAWRPACRLLVVRLTIPSFRSEWNSLVPRLFVGERLGTRLQGEWYNFTTRTGNWSSVTSLKSKKSFGTRFSHHLSTSVFIWSLQSKHWHTIWSWENLLSTEKPLKEQLTLDEWRTLWSQHRQVHSVTASSYQQWCVKQLYYQQWCMKQLYLVAAETITEWGTQA